MTMTDQEPPHTLTASDFYKRPVWMDRGNCVGTVDLTEDGSIMYPDRSNGDVSFAKAICNGSPGRAERRKADGTLISPAQPARPVCPVRDICLDFALDHGERWGVWGGKSERERRYLQRARKRQQRLAAKAAAAKEAAKKKRVVPKKRVVAKATTTTKVVVRKSR